MITDAGPREPLQSNETVNEGACVADTLKGLAHRSLQIVCYLAKGNEGWALFGNEVYRLLFSIHSLIVLHGIL